MTVSKAGNNKLNNQQLKHFDMHTSEDLKKFCPWIYDDNNEPIVYTCDQENRPPYRTFNGSCNFLSG